jgi:hypothetical protein
LSIYATATLVSYFVYDICNLGRGADNPTLEKTLVAKSEEEIAGYFSWQKLLRSPCRAVEPIMMTMMIYNLSINN